MSANTASKKVTVTGTNANGKPFTAEVNVKITSNAPKVVNQQAATAAAQAAAPVAEAAAAPVVVPETPVTASPETTAPVNNAKAKANAMRKEMGLEPSTGGRRMKHRKTKRRAHKKRHTRKH